MVGFGVPASERTTVAQRPDTRPAAAGNKHLTNRIGAKLEARLVQGPPAHFALFGAQLAADADLSECFRIVVNSSPLETPPAILGRYRMERDIVRFFPRFPLSHSIKYEMQLGPLLENAAPGAQPLLFVLPPPPAAPAFIAAVYPSTSQLPENLLKFYIHFSQPMSRGDAYDHIQLWEGDQRVEHPFLELGEELWNSDQTRFTLFFHPGRIKRGLKPNEELGNSLRAGRSYSLRIDSNWKTAHNVPLADGFVKQFRVVKADRTQPDPESWKIETPEKNSRNPVCLVFNEALDRALLNRVLSIQHPERGIVHGRVQIAAEETRWEFVPNEAWRVGTYYIHVAANLEDLGGNSIARPFEVKLEHQVAAAPETQIAVEFIVK